MKLLEAKTKKFKWQGMLKNKKKSSSGKECSKQKKHKVQVARHAPNKKSVLASLNAALLGLGAQLPAREWVNPALKPDY